MSFFKDLLETTTSVLRLAEHTRENREEIKAIRGDLDDAIGVIELLKLEIARVSEREARERQVMLLQIENLLLRRRDTLALMAPAEEGG
jgi:hypothetical protein